MDVVLMDPKTGRRVLLKRAQLDQTCKYCGLELRGEIIAHVDGSPAGWTCPAHLERDLLMTSPTPTALAKAKARQQLRDAQPGDVTTVTHTLLTALEAW